MVEDRSLAGHLRFLLKDTAVYGLAGAVAKLLAIFTVPILTRLFSTSEYGLIDAITIVGTVFIPAVILGQDSSIGRFYYDTDDRRERREIVSTGLSVQMAFSALVAAAQFILAAPILDAYLRSTAEVDCMRLMALALPATVLVRNTQNLLKWTFRRRRYLVLTLGITVVNVAATLFLVLVARLGVTGVFYANLFAQAAFAGTGMWFCRDLIAARFNWRPWLKPMVLFGLPYTLVGIADAVFPSVDRFFIARYLTLDSLGIYSVGMKVASLLMLVVTGFQTAWGPFAYATYRQPGANQTFARILLLFTYVGCLGVVGLVALGKPFDSADGLGEVRRQLSPGGTVGFLSNTGGDLLHCLHRHGTVQENDLQRRSLHERSCSLRGPCQHTRSHSRAPGRSAGAAVGKGYQHHGRHRRGRKAVSYPLRLPTVPRHPGAGRPVRPIPDNPGR